MLSIDFSKPSARVRWSLRNQTVLCCMFRFFREDKDAFRRTFASLFADDLRHFDHELPYATLNTQWSDLRRHGDPVWHRVHICTAFPASGPWLLVVSSIKDRAFSLGFSLVEKLVDDTDTSTFRLNPSRRRNRRDLLSEIYATTPSSAQSSSSSSSSPASPSSPSIKSSGFPESPAPLDTTDEKVCDFFDDGNNDKPDRTSDKDEDPPGILYRWSNVSSQGVNARTLILSGLFSNTEQDPFLPEEIPQTDFENYVRSHVSISKTVTPFVSTFNSPLAPVHRSLRAREGALISIIDSSRLEGHVYSARKLVRDLDIRIPGYRGIGEYLVWGRVPTPAIICSFTTTELVTIANDDTEIAQLLQLDRIEAYKRNQSRLKRALSRGPGKLDRRSGTAVGRLLGELNLPDAYINRVALGICRSWKFSTSGSEHDYIKGVRQGFLSSSASLETQVVVSARPPIQRELSPPTEEDSDIAMDEEPEDEDDCIPSIETLYPSPQQSTTSQCPTVEYFDPTNQQWTVNAPDTPVANPVGHHRQQSSQVTTSSMIMSDDDVNAFMSEFDL